VFSCVRTAEARECGCARGGDATGDAAFRAGVAATRAKVRELNDVVVQALVKEGVNARGISPHVEGWRTRGVGVVEYAPMDALERARADGAVPVLHGDVVDDSVQGTSVLSGDDIVEFCAIWVQKQSAWLDDDSNAAPRDGKGSNAALRVAFLSNVFGCYDAPPTRDVVAREDDFDVPLEIDQGESVNLVRVIEVEPMSSAAMGDDIDARVVSVVPLIDACVVPSSTSAPPPPPLSSSSPPPSIRFENTPTDVTGGAKAKLAAAMRVARASGADVCVTRPGVVRLAHTPSRTTNPALDALTGARTSRDDPFLGTIVRLAANPPR
jgi:isopentenyl phosphate kinase